MSVARGLNIGNDSVVFRLDYDRLQLLEDRLDMGVMAIAAQLARGMLPCRQVVEIVAICSVPSLSMHGLGEKVLHCGMGQVFAALADLLCDVLGGEVASPTVSSDADLSDLMARFPD